MKKQKTITCICGVITKVANPMRTCGKTICAKEWKRLGRLKSNRKVTIKRQVRMLFPKIEFNIK